MQPQDENKLSGNLQEKIRLSQEAFETAKRVSNLLQQHFTIHDMNVAATAQQVLVVAGGVASEYESRAVEQFLQSNMPGWQLTLNLQISNDQ